ncbi:hypothetical protein BD626DRAFT_564877 [Schizophyllum amplum]|uniref:Uncharacterized protein n=1 Tax=Schizophyllum amplum TaxID=97359 RepID=A0A550CT98_9AGAR|nr:hypothetical protein BD626DRAFT_564877 [Auriculariopsis ampla]
MALMHEMRDVCNRARGDGTNLPQNLVLVANLNDPLPDRLDPPCSKATLSSPGRPSRWGTAMISLRRTRARPNHRASVDLSPVPLLCRLLGKNSAYAAPNSVPTGCNARVHGHLRVTAETIAYVAMQARFVCSAVRNRSLADGDLTMQAF